MRFIYKWSLILVIFFTTFAQAEVWVTGSYDNNVDISQELSVANATRLVVTVQGRTERYYDFVYIYDANGQLIRTFDGFINSTFTVDGSSITARLVSDYSITSTGVTVTALAETSTADTTPPVITLNGDATMTLTIGDTFTDPGATAQDNIDGTVNVITTGTVNTTTAGTYTLTYTATDASGNTATLTRTVIVNDTTDGTYGPELIYGAGNDNGVINTQSWIPFGDNSLVLTRTYSIHTYLYAVARIADAGIYQAFPTITGRTYQVSATLLGADAGMNAEFINDSYITVSNNVPTTTKSNLITESSFVTGATETVVTFTFTAQSTTSYLAVRSDTPWYYGNARAISVKEILNGGNTDTTPPVITLNGDATMTLTIGDTFTDPGATAQDNIDGTVNVITTGTVNTTTAGTYTLTYTATDASGNTATLTRTVIVNDTVTPPPTSNATLIHNWGLDEAAAPFIDNIGNSDGTCVALNCPIQTLGQVGTAQRFDGSKTIVINSDPSLDSTENESYSIEFWMRAEDSASNQVAVGRGLGGIYLWVGTQGTKVKFQLPGGPANVESSGNIVLNEWTHVAIVKDASTEQAFLYINGALDNTYTSPRADFTGIYNLEIGSLNDSYRFNGDLDDVKLYRGTLSADEILTHFNSPTSGADTTPPFISIIGDTNMVINAGTIYTELGATAEDTRDGTLPVTINGTVNTNIAGIYTVTYTATDSSGNTATSIRTVTVEIPNGSREFAFFADEYNDFNDSTTGEGTGNRILQVDLEHMTLTNSLDVPGILGHHSDNGYNSKMYAVPKDSNFLNVIEIRKDEFGNTTMNNARQINLIHKPRSGDAYNPDLNVILMTAKNRPMGSFINVMTDQVTGTIGEEIDCMLDDGTMLLSHPDANTHEGALRYQCANDDHGGDQISGHPYWLTNEYAAIVDRTNRQIHLYRVWQDGNATRSQFVNSLTTRTSIHQIIPRDRSALSTDQQMDFYAVEEGKHADDLLNGGIPHALIHMRLTTNGLELVRRIDLQRTEVYNQEKSERILEECVLIYRNENNYRGDLTLTEAYQELFTREELPVHPNQNPGADFPIECLYPGIPGGHNADFAPNNRHVYVGMAGGIMSIIDVDQWTVVNNLDIGRATGPGHTCFSARHGIALTTQHLGDYIRVIRGIDTARPTVAERLMLPFEREGLIETTQSHTCYVDDNEDYYYNAWTDGGVLFKMDLAAISANTNGFATDMIVDSVYTGGIPIQGSFLKLDDILLGN